MSHRPEILDQAALLSDPTRCRLLILLERQELTVSELCVALQLPQSTVSRHLKALRDKAWIDSRRDGTRHFYETTLEELPPAQRRLWMLIRDSVTSSASCAQDLQRLEQVLAERSRRSAEFFDRSAADWDSVRRDLFGDRFDLLAMLAMADSSWVVGDLGCGTGRLSGRLAPFVDETAGAERSYRHLYFNANKRSLVLDPSQEDDRERLRELAASSDVLLTTSTPGLMATLGLSYDDLRAVNPGLIYTSITPFGLEGEWASWKATDLVASAAGGLLQVTGERDDPPTHGPAFPAYTMAGLTAASGTLIALWGRETQAGRPGVHLDISMQEATSFAVVQTSNPNHYTWRGDIPVRPALSQSMRCADGKWVGVNIMPTRMEEFISLLDEAGVEHSFTVDDWQLVHAAGAAWKYLENPLQYKAMELAARYPRDEFLEKIWRSGMPAMPTLDFPQMLDSEHYRVSGQFHDVEHETLGRPLRFSRGPVDAVAPERPLRRAPLLGEDAESAPWAEAASTPQADPSAAMPEMPLAGIRVVDFTWVAAGPLGTRILANFGAEVIKVESSVRMDTLRNQMLPGDRYHVDLCDLFNDANTGKRSVTLDLTTERGRELIRELIAVSDVVIDNYTSGKLAKMGFAYDELRRRNPKLVMLHLPGVGGDSPWVSHRTLGNLLMAASGQNSLMGFPGRPPRGMGIAYPDFTSPHLVVTSVLAALREAERSGEGREMLLSQLSATVSLLGAEWMRFSHTGEQPPLPGNRDPNFCPHGVFRTSGDDTWIAIAVASDEEWAALAELIGGEMLVDFATEAGRRAAEDDLDACVEAWTQDQDRWELATTLQEHGIAAAPVENLRDMIETDPQMRRHYQRIRQPSDPDFEIVIDGEPIRFAGQDRVLERAPMLGEHNEYVLGEILGLSQQEFDGLVVNGVIA